MTQSADYLLKIEGGRSLYVTREELIIWLPEEQFDVQHILERLNENEKVELSSSFGIRFTLEKVG